MKSIPFGDAKNAAKEKEYFDNELAISRVLQHPNIVRLHDTIHDDEAQSWYLVMEMCTGGDLFNHILAKGKPGSIREWTIARYVRDMLDGIRYCHFHHIMHRDIKTENYMLATTSDHAPLKLIDFGLATKFESGVPLKKPCGTVNFMAPEVISGSYNEKGDIWSIGIVMYILCVIKPPFLSGDGDDKKTRQLITGPVTVDNVFRQTEHAHRWTQAKYRCVGMKALLKQLLNKNPSVRPSAKEVLKENEWMRMQNESSSTPCCTVQ